MKFPLEPFQWVSWAGEEVVEDLVLMEMVFERKNYITALDTAEACILNGIPPVLIYHGEVHA